MLCLIDNYDSFTYNLVHYLHDLGVEVRVILNDEMSADEVLALAPTHIVLSPGAGTPDDAGISKELLAQAARARIPTLGVCLGHEVIGEVFGGRVSHAREIMHGKASRIWHGGEGLFADLPSSFLAARYHSLVIDRATLPACLKITAWTARERAGGAEGADGAQAAGGREDARGAGGERDAIDEIMAVSHRTLPIHGVQFHPESIISEHGRAILASFLAREPPGELRTS